MSMVQRRWDPVSVVTWTLILLYVLAVFSIAGYFIHAAFASSEPRCDPPAVVQGPNYGISATACYG